MMIFAALWGLATTFELPSRQTLMMEQVGKRDFVLIQDCFGRQWNSGIIKMRRSEVHSHLN